MLEQQTLQFQRPISFVTETIGQECKNNLIFFSEKRWFLYTCLDFNVNKQLKRLVIPNVFFSGKHSYKIFGLMISFFFSYDCHSIVCPFLQRFLQKELLDHFLPFTILFRNPQIFVHFLVLIFPTTTRFPTQLFQPSLLLHIAVEQKMPCRSPCNVAKN